jgi:hypothetical protein
MGRPLRLTLVKVTETNKGNVKEKINAHVSGCPVDRSDPRFKLIERNIKNDTQFKQKYGGIDIYVYPSAA